jgi:hypothetical protein
MASEVMDLPDPLSPRWQGFRPVQGEGQVLHKRAQAGFGADRDAQPFDPQDGCPGPWPPRRLAGLPQGSFEDDPGEVEADDPVRHVDDLRDAQVAADRTQHVGVDRRHACAGGQKVDHPRHRVRAAVIRSGPMPVVASYPLASRCRVTGPGVVKRGVFRLALHEIQRQHHVHRATRWPCRRPRRRPARHGCRPR